VSDTIQRFDLVGDYELTIAPQEDGDYVLHADHLAAMAAKDAEIAAMKGEDHADRCAQSRRLKEQLRAAEQEAAGLRALVHRMAEIGPTRSIDWWRSEIAKYLGVRDES
jgi:hypothetical protein